jgi:hypothetical protein
MSNSQKPVSIFSAKSSKPTSSAPAFFAASASSPCAKTITLNNFPVPFGKTVEPLTF